MPLDPCPPPLFTPYRLRELVLPNRIVVSSMCQYRADDGLPNDWHLVHLGSRAIGGAGLVMTEMTDVSREGRISPGCAGMYLPAHVAGWRRIVEFVHRESEAKIGIQLSHAGRKGSTCVLWEGEDEPLPEGNWPLIAPSPIPYRPHNQTPREMTRADMDQVAADFVRATGMADAAGFDLLELHLAHGYLLASFISPLTNRRTDEYGGSLANRMRYPLEIVTRVRAEWPAGQAAVGQDLGGGLGARRHGGARRGGGGADGGRRRAPISWTSPRGRPSPRPSRSTAASSRRRSATGSGTRRGCPR